MSNFANPTDWRLLINERRQALPGSNGRLRPIPAIEPDAQFTYPIVLVHVSSINSPASWFLAGEFLQIGLTSVGASYAQLASRKATLGRYQIIQFSDVSYDKSNLRYLLSFVPQRYIPDVTVRVWEYRGIGQPETLGEISNKIGATLSAVQSNKTSINELKAKINRLNELIGGE